MIINQQNHNHQPPSILLFLWLFRITHKLIHRWFWSVVFAMILPVLSGLCSPNHWHVDLFDQVDPHHQESHLLFLGRCEINYWCPHQVAPRLLPKLSAPALLLSNVFGEMFFLQLVKYSIKQDNINLQPSSAVILFFPKIKQTANYKKSISSNNINLHPSSAVIFSSSPK